ncbi:hypothetical protein GAY31_17470 [Azospirillum brasilense]|nr:hypothetical protein [Azospirillum brasilense]
MATAPVAMMALMAASTAVSVYSSVQQGQAHSAALKAQQQQQQQREEQLRTRAMQDEAARREELASNLSTIEAIRAGRGLSQSSPTALVIRDDLTDTAMDDMRVSRLNILNGAESARQSAQQAGNAASNALTAGYLGAGKSLLDFGANMAGGMGGSGSSYTKGTRGGYGRLVGGV